MVRSLLLLSAILLAGCSTRVVPRTDSPPTARPQPVPPPTIRVDPLPVRPTPTPVPAPNPAAPRVDGPRAALPSVDARGARARAADAGLRPGPTVASLGLSPAAAARALGAFRISCPVAVRRNDASGLTRPGDWTDACAAAARWSDADAATFFATHFETVEVADGTAFSTGYYEPSIRGCRTRRPGCETPIYAIPSDRRAFSRAQIDNGALAGQGLEIGYVVDPIDLFFLQIQGSGRINLPDGGVMRIGYAAQNGRGYVPVGRILRERGQLAPNNISLQTIQAWMRAQPDRGRALMQENPSYIFFRELTGPGPIGSLGVPVTSRATVAVDPSFVTYGAPIVLARMEQGVANGLWVAQDTGGAIRGANRFDTFWGAGPDAEGIAGPLQTRGYALLLLPRGTLRRLSGNAAQP